MTETVATTNETRAYQQMEHKLGAEGMAMLDEQLVVWNELNQRELASPLRDALRAGHAELPVGTLLHSMGMYGFNPDAVKSVAEKGIVSGELVGTTEDSETHGCADFFRVPKDTTVSSYFQEASTPVKIGNIHSQRGERLLLRGITFIVDPEAEGMDSLLQRDGYRDPAMGGFVRPPEGRTAEDTAAILGGVPRGAIAGLIVGEGLMQKEGVAELLNAYFPDTPKLDHTGALYPQPTPATT